MVIHLPVYLASLPLTAALVSFGVFLLFAVPFRIVLGWFYNRTGSLIIVALFHAAFNGTGASGIVDPAAVSVPALVFAAIPIAIAAGWLMWWTHGRLGVMGGLTPLA